MPALENISALVTGAGSGLGAAIARRLAADGARLWVNDIDAESAGKIAAEVGGEAVVFDVADARAVDAAIDAIVAAHGSIGIVVNNAGVINNRPEVRERGMAAMLARMGGQEPEPVGAISELSDDQWDRVIRIHLYGTFHGTRGAARHMERQRHGHIVNLGSIYGLKGSAATPEYAAAKHGIVGLTRSVGLEMAPLGVHVNAVAPGFIDTPLLAPIEAEQRAMVAAQIPAGRFGVPEDIADAVRFLAGPESSYCFGEILTVSGGFL